MLQPSSHKCFNGCNIYMHFIDILAEILGDSIANCPCWLPKQVYYSAQPLAGKGDNLHGAKYSPKVELGRGEDTQHLHHCNFLQRKLAADALRSNFRLENSIPSKANAMYPLHVSFRIN